ncbi:MAG: hydroxymethylbilane synthase [Caldilineaceae bacterium]
MAEQTLPLPRLRMGTRGSALARWQTDYIAARLQEAWPGLEIDITVLHTQGDRILDKPLPLIGGKGLFTAELEAALHAGEIDLAVHSLKDLPTEITTGLAIGAIPVRAPVHDVLVSRSGRRLAELPPGATIGTSSRRRAAQIRHRYPYLQMADIRGNVDTRVRKALDPDGPYDAIVLARAGIERLAHADVITEILDLDVMLPAPGQGALAVQCRDDQLLRTLLAPIDHAPTRAAVEAERAFLGGLGGGCAVPIAALAVVEVGDGTILRLQGRVTALDGTNQVEVAAEGDAGDAHNLGERLAQRALDEGAAVLLAGITA